MAVAVAWAARAALLMLPLLLLCFAAVRTQCAAHGRRDKWRAGTDR
jgi:hypothetical protein